MSYTFSFSSTSSSLTSVFEDPIDLEDGEWAMGLVNFEAYYTTPNISTENNILSYVINGKEDSVEIPVGAYTIEHLQDMIKTLLTETQVTIKLTPDSNTQHCSIESNADIDFTKPRSPRQLLGFQADYLQAGFLHISPFPVKITSLNVLRINCNITAGSYENGQPAHIIHEFFPGVLPGFKIIEAPQNVLYLPITVNRIKNIVLTLTHENVRLLDFRGDTINIRLHLKRL